jgi:tetratricopeptide (TPR) repeat protein
MKAVDREDRTVVKKKSKVLLFSILALIGVLVLSFITVFSYKLINKHIRNSASVTALYDHWNKYDYQGTYDVAGAIIAKKPLQNTARTLRGYSAFYLAVAQTDNTLAQNYLDEAINNMRIALQNMNKKSSGQLEYMLGKAYFYKDEMSSYQYYADLAVKYLEKSILDNYKANDISEYLGISYASLGMTQKSISAFTEALITRESDTLLLSIAEQYYLIGQGSAAKQYLYRVNTISQNSDILNKSHILLGQIYTDETNYTDAQTEFETILEKNENSADAHYGLGVLYEKQGDMVKARSEWRKCLRIQVNHPGALQKMAENK